MLARAIAIAAVIFASAPARADRTVAIAPLSTLGTEDTSASTRKLIAQLEQATASLRGTQLISAAQVADAIQRAKRPHLKACEGEPACLAELGKLVGAQIVIAGEVGGLGEAKIVYLGAVDVAAGKELRSTMLTAGAARSDGGPQGAVIRLLDPERYRGTLRFAIDVTGTTVYVNGARIAVAARGDVSLPVGTHAVRITHPEYRDFVRFIDVAYGKTTDVPVTMQQYSVVERDVRGNPIQRAAAADPPWYRRWYTVGGGAVGLAAITGLIVWAIVREPYDARCVGERCD